MKLRWANVIVFVLISACFSAAVYKIDQNSIERVAKAQAAAMAASRDVTSVCRADINAINEAHASIRGGFLLQAKISEDNIHAIHYGFRHDLIPPNLHAYYVKALGRQQQNRVDELRFAHSIVQLAPLC